VANKLKTRTGLTLKTIHPVASLPAIGEVLPSPNGSALDTGVAAAAAADEDGEGNWRGRFEPACLGNQLSRGARDALGGAGRRWGACLVVAGSLAPRGEGDDPGAGEVPETGQANPGAGAGRGREDS